MSGSRWTIGPEEFRKLFERPDPAQVANIPVRLRLLTQIYGRVADEALAGFGLTLSRYTVLDALSSHPGISGAGLADLTSQTPQSLNGMVASLLDGGLVHRKQAVGRAKLHYLTPQGTAVVNEAQVALTDLHRRTFSAFDSQRIERLVKDLEDLSASFLLERRPGRQK
ncbi:MarR family winged helix-turn-helix transcriptional regulator [Pseudarthrobacter sp. NPDC058329]|uniref:MarR family winged helix-turn-helix transcriptional regulator n=1 Tax=Pseudarthrobacter sp. NPDC058329 TaxID=3346448 RepID=UPI0036DBC345